MERCFGCILSVILLNVDQGQVEDGAKKQPVGHCLSEWFTGRDVVKV